MAHFAEIDENDKVVRVIVIDNAKLLCESGNESEEKGVEFLISLFGEGRLWIQTSYNGNFRGKYACIGDSYDLVNDIFITDTE